MEIFILGVVLIVAMWTVDGCNPNCEKKSRKRYKKLLTTR